MKDREYYIDGIKFLACLGIFLFHFNIAFSFCEPFAIQNFIKYTPVSILFDNMMVYLFCVLSGYVVCRANISSLKQLFTKVLLRYCRFALPIFAAYVVVWIFGLIWGFPVTRVSAFFPEYELANYYQNPITFKTLLYEPFIKIWFSASSVITPLWMIRYVLYGSVLIYVFQYLNSKWKKGYIFFAVLFCIVIGILDMRTWLVLSTFLGAILYKIKETGNLIINKIICILLMLFVVVMTWFGHEYIYGVLKSYVNLPAALNMNGHWKALYMTILVFALSHNKEVQSVFGAIGKMKMSKCSFAVFLLHFPLICSFSMSLYWCFRDYLKYTGVIYSVIFIVTVLLLFLLAYLFQRYVEQGINKLISIYKHN